MAGSGNIAKALQRWDGWCRIARAQGSVNEQAAAERQERIRKACASFRYFVTAYFPHLATAETPDFHVDLANKVKRNLTIKVLVRWGRGMAKSIVCDVLIPLWLWINGEDIYLVLVGNTEDKAKKLLGDIADEFAGNERLIADFGAQRTSQWSDNYFVCRERFIGAALGMGQEVRGLRKGARRPTLCICDDLEDKDTVKNPKRQEEMANWILTALIPTMDGPMRRLLVPNNNFAPRTIQGELERRNPKWIVHRVDATVGPERKPRWESKYPDDYFVQIEHDLGTIAFEAEYNNRPWVEGKVFTQEMIDRVWAPLPSLSKFRHITGRWDPAYSGKNDFNAVRIWGLYDHRMYLIASYVRQRTMNSTLDWIQDYDSRLPQGVVVHWRVESQFWNEPLRRAIDESNARAGRQLNISVVPSPKTKKIDRLLSVYSYYENGRIRYNERERNNADFIEGTRQLLGIEPGYRTHDDSPDADERAISDLAAFDRAFAFSPMIGQMSRGDSNSRY